MIKKVVEAWRRVVAGELPEALGRSAGGRARSSTGRSWRNQTDGPSQRSLTNTRGTRPASKSQIPGQINEGRPVVVRDEGARCRSGCQRG
jgi:hypothetical protein